MALQLEIVTPSQRALTVTCDEVRLPGAQGGFGVKPGHTPVVAQLRAGELTYVAHGQEHRYAVGEGFAEVSQDRVRVLAEEALRADQLDAAQVQAELTRLRMHLTTLREGDPAYDLARAELERAAARSFVLRLR